MNACDNALCRCACHAPVTLDVAATLARLGCPLLPLGRMQGRMLAAVDALSDESPDGVAPYAALYRAIYDLDDPPSHGDRHAMRQTAQWLRAKLEPHGWAVRAVESRGLRLVAITPEEAARKGTCVDCGGPRSTGARWRCRACQAARTAARKAAREAPCPRCEGPMRDGSALCRACRVAESRRAAGELRACPDCDGPKSREAARCNACAQARRNVVQYDQCPHCGGQKVRRSRRCYACARADRRAWQRVGMGNREIIEAGIASLHGLSGERLEQVATAGAARRGG